MAASSCSQCSGSSAGASMGYEPDISSIHNVVSLLHQLKSPSPADIAWLRKTKTNEPPHGKQKCREYLCLTQRGFFQPRSKKFQVKPFNCFSLSFLLFSVSRATQPETKHPQ